MAPVRQPAGLRRQFMTIMALILAPVFMLFAGVSLVAGLQVINSQEEKLNHAVLSFLGEVMGNYHQRAESELASLTSYLDVRGFAAEADRRFVQDMADGILASNQHFTAIQVTDSGGRVRLASPADSERLGNDDSRQEHVLRARNEIYWSPAAISPYTGDAVVSLSGPWKGGVVTIFLNLRPIQVSLGTIAPQSLGAITITDALGTIIADSDSGKVARRESFPVATLDSGSIPDAEPERYRSSPDAPTLLVQGLRMAHSGWWVYVLVPEDIHLAPARSFLLVSALFLTLALVIGMATGLVWTRRLTRQLTAFLAAAQRISQGDYGRELPIPHDPAEFRRLAEAFNLMQQAVVKRESDITQLNQDLEIRVGERTAALEDSNTELEAALESLKSAQDQMVQAERLSAIGQLVAGVAHEINTPLGNALTTVTYQERQAAECQAYVESGQIGRNYLEKFIEGTRSSSQIVSRNLERAARLIGTLKRLAEDHSRDERQTFRLGDYLTELCRTLRSAVGDRPVSIASRVPPELVLHASQAVFAQIVDHLVRNSLEHAFAPAQPGRIDIEARSEGGTVVLVYRDDGAGIAPENLSHVFEPFFTTRRLEGSTGLGLHLVNNMVRNQLGGSISVASTPGAGVEFTIRLPGMLAVPVFPR